MVIRGVVPREMADRAVADIANFVDADLSDSSTWYNGHPVNDGVVPIHHAQSVWDIRQHPNVYAVFSEFWRNPKLALDINRSCFRPPANAEFPTLSRGEIHWDADPRANAPPSLQGIVLLTDVGIDAGGFQCVPSVYQNLSAWLDQHARHDAFEFLRPGISQDDAVQVEGNAGDIILWSTLLPHGPAPNDSDRPRIATFMTHQPPPDNAQFRANLIDWWQTKRAPVHWRNMLGVRDPEPGPPAVLDALGRRLLGLDPWNT